MGRTWWSSGRAGTPSIHPFSIMSQHLAWPGTEQAFNWYLLTDKAMWLVQGGTTRKEQSQTERELTLTIQIWHHHSYRKLIFFNRRDLCSVHVLWPQSLAGNGHRLGRRLIFIYQRCHLFGEPAFRCMWDGRSESEGHSVVSNSLWLHEL